MNQELDLEELSDGLDDFDVDYFAEDQFKEQKFKQFGDILFDKKLYELFDRNKVMIIDENNSKNYFPVGNLITTSDLIGYFDFNLDILKVGDIKITSLSENNLTIDSLINKPNETVISLPQNEERLLEVTVTGASKNVGSFFLQPGSL